MVTNNTDVSSGATNALSLLLREDPLLIQHGLTSYRGLTNENIDDNITNEALEKNSNIDGNNNTTITLQCEYVKNNVLVGEPMDIINNFAITGIRISNKKNNIMIPIFIWAVFSTCAIIIPLYTNDNWSILLTLLMILCTICLHYCLIEPFSQYSPESDW